MYLATAILRVSNFSQTIEKKRARDRSLQEPAFGLEERREGVLLGLEAPKIEGRDGVVVEMEVRRKSGRGLREIFVLSTSTNVPTTPEGVPRGELGGKLCLLDDHPLYTPPAITERDSKDSAVEWTGDDEVETTFSLGLTEKQRKDREGVVLPYFDAQRGGGGGEGGRILYEMDRVDDFDEEEDEI
jgi:elongator complex protein 5